jgi:hypothetical protein
LEAAVARGNVAAFDELIDYDALTKVVTSGIAAAPAVREGFIAGVKGKAKGGRTFGAELVRSTSDGGTYRFLRLLKEDGRSVPLFRMQGPNGLNYHKLYVDRRARDGKPAITDVHMALSGELFTQMMRRMYIPLAMQSTGGKERTPEEREFFRTMDQFVEMNKARQEGRHADVLKVYGQMPEKVRRQKHVQLFRLGSAPLVSEEEYKLALADAAPIFKDEVAADLLAIDALIYRNKYDDALAAADRIDKRIGGDPYLDVIRGTITMTAGKPAEAKAFAQSALKREPGLYAARDMLLSLAVQEKDHAETARLLTLFEKEHGLDFDDLKAAEGYEAFVQSQEYQQWLKRPRPKR